MLLGKRLRIAREANQHYQRLKAQNPSSTHEQLEEEVADLMRHEYGADIDWANILQIILRVLALLAPLLLKKEGQ